MSTTTSESAVDAVPVLTLPLQAIRTFPVAGYGHGATIKITAKAYRLGQNKHPHFSVTAEVWSPRRRNDCEACGCMHEEIAKVWPAVRPIIALHLAHADDGEPLHAELNGWYRLEGATGASKARYLALFAGMMRISVEEAEALVESLAGKENPQEKFGVWLETQRARWAAEAAAGVELLKHLSSLT